MNRALTLKQATAAVNLLMGCLDAAQTTLAQIINDPGNPRNVNMAIHVFRENQIIHKIVKDKLPCSTKT